MWFTIILLGCLAVLVAGMFLWLRSQRDRSEVAPVFTPPEILATLRQSATPTPSDVEAMAIIRSAIAASDLESLRAFVHPSPEVGEQEMLGFFAATKERDGILIQHQWIGRADSLDLQNQSTMLVFNRDGKTHRRTAMLLPSESGNWRLDFPSYARWCDPPIRLMDDPAGYPGGRVRVIANRDNYFNGPFADERTWACYMIGSPDNETPAFGYCRIGSREQLTLESIIMRTQDPPRVTLDVARLDGAEPRQLLINGVIAEGWVVAAPAMAR